MDLVIRQPNGKSHRTTALNVDTNPAHARGSGGRGERREVPLNAVMLIKQAESTTQNREKSRPGVMEDEKATKLKGTLTSVSSYSSMQSSRVSRLSASSAGTSLYRAACAEAEPPGVPYF
jgi:hypothetical protein